ncbi:uncharacterized protein N7484_000471 [Penicillium longicatenatum]|uniref:uncharacterized protein n=1 Tax=Penicillium longicatenatum TaxID=1561947 RepID=UPI002546CA3A|nr:uncharacterized protein N7484_000471 [Penicillium longicatenatum]KAJ5661099.1 hypothetical protein N7484_000471 [Penicillium longicatenatum]
MVLFLFASYRNPSYSNLCRRGRAHPRITGYDDHKCTGHATLQEARSWMKEKGVAEPKEIITSEEEKTGPIGGKGFYAVANGGTPEIYEFYRGGNGAKKEVDNVKSSCHKRFRTRAQAEAFIADWKETYADIWREEIKKALDEGFRPHGTDAFRSDEMRRIIRLFLHEPVTPAKIDELAEMTKKQL